MVLEYDPQNNQLPMDPVWTYTKAVFFIYENIIIAKKAKISEEKQPVPNIKWNKEVRKDRLGVRTLLSPKQQVLIGHGRELNPIQPQLLKYCGVKQDCFFWD